MKTHVYDGRIPKGAELQRVVREALTTENDLPIMFIRIN